MDVIDGSAPIEVDIDPVVFQNFADLEKEFASVELSALRRKEFHLAPLYTKRNALSSQIPNFWPAVLLNGPQEFQTVLGESDAETVAAIKSLNIERYQIKSETEGEPRSLRFTFEFEENDIFEDTTVVKEFEFVENEDKSGAFVSKPVGLKWKKKGKKTTTGLLDLAVDLYKAEETVKLKDGKSGRDLEVVDREGLWQYEKLREKLAKLQEDEEAEQSWLDFFGFRGAVSGSKKSEDKEENGAGEDEDGMDEDDGLLDVEIFNPGEEVAISLAEDLWPNVMDYFMVSQQEPDFDPEMFEDDDDDEDEDEDEDSEDGGLDIAPDLLEIAQAGSGRPSKRQRTE